MMSFNDKNTIIYHDSCPCFAIEWWSGQGINDGTFMVDHSYISII
jgi:hypothetical protein